MKTAIITTTINVPTLLADYAKNVKKYKHDAFFVVIGDKKTPKATKPYCKKIAKQFKVTIEYLDIPDQLKYLRKFPELNKHLVYNSIQRRNIGILLAYEMGAEKIITIDDDNFFISKDFIKLHALGKRNLETISSSTGWLNVCDQLKEKHNRRFYHRGFAQEYRFLDEKTKSIKKNINVVVNAGFWLNDPDIDALTRLYFPNNDITVTAYKKKNDFAVAKKTWTPFNSQNTALARDIIPAYFLSPLVGRYDDIWGAYVVKRISDYLGDYIAFGQPLVNQERNIHNYWKDLAKEDLGMQLTTDFVNLLKKIKLTGKNYQDSFAQLTKQLDILVKKYDGTPAQQKFLKDYVAGMKVWVKTFKRMTQK